MESVLRAQVCACPQKRHALCASIERCGNDLMLSILAGMPEIYDNWLLSRKGERCEPFMNLSRGSPLV